MTEFATVVLIQLALHLIVAIIHKRQWLAHIADKEAAWHKERKDLLDRIQAPTFTEYTNKVIREKKAEKPEEPKEPVDFIS